MVTARRYQTFWPRCWAGIIDFVVLLPVLLVGLQIWSSDLSHASKSLLLVIADLSSHAYSIGMHWRFGATVGKQLLGLRVLDVSEVPISLGQALRRDAINIVLSSYSTVLSIQAIYANIPAEAASDDISSWTSSVVLGLELVTTLFNAKRRSLHDLVAGTVVVRVSSAAGRVSA